MNLFYIPDPGNGCKEIYLNNSTNLFLLDGGRDGGQGDRLHGDGLVVALVVELAEEGCRPDAVVPLQLWGRVVEAGEVDRVGDPLVLQRPGRRRRRDVAAEETARAQGV